MLRSALLVVASSLLFALAGVAVKQATAELPNSVVVFFRNVFSLLLLLPWLVAKGPSGVRTRHLSLHLLRAAATLSALYCYYYAVAQIALADAVLLQFTGPIFVPLLAFLVYRIAVSGQLMLAILIGFAGVALILKPGSEVFSLGAVGGVAAGFFGAVAVLTIWRMSDTEPALRIVFYFNLIASVASAVPLAWDWQPPTGIQWLYLGALAVLSTAAHILITIGCTIAPADRAYTLSYSSVVFAAALAWGLWGERVDFVMVLGAVLVGIAGTMATRMRVGPVSLSASSAGQARS
jgi:drug/metabolite transporter (DMT)-like permease